MSAGAEPGPVLTLAEAVAWAKEKCAEAAPCTDVALLESGACSEIVARLWGPHTDLVMKTSRGVYRGAELRAEYGALRSLQNSPVPSPRPVGFWQRRNCCLLLRGYVPGQPLGTGLGAAGPRERLSMIEAMARCLRSVHDLCQPTTGAAECLEGQLSLAAAHLQAGVLDPEEFHAEAGDLDPADVLARLRSDRPPEASSCLLHGDFRPKNLLWQDGAVSGVIDWAFCDVGDPCYDLGIVSDGGWLRGEAEWQAFVGAYGGPPPSPARLRYYELLTKFTNI